MDQDTLKSRWKRLRGEAKTQWACLTDHDLRAVKGSADRLSGALQQRYGYSRRQAAREIDRFLSEYGDGKERAERAAREVRQELQATGRKVMTRARETAADVGPDLERARRDLEHVGQKVAADVRDTATMAAGELQHTGQKAVSTARETVSHRPLVSVAAALGLGALLGLGIALIIAMGRSSE